MFEQHSSHQEKPTGSYDKQELLKTLGASEAHLLVFFDAISQRVHYFDNHPAKNAAEEEEERKTRELHSFALEKLFETHQLTEMLH